jgi:hypothetical protein
MDISRKKHTLLELRRQNLNQTSSWTSTRQRLKEWPAIDDSDGSNHAVRPHAKRMLSGENEVHQVHSDQSSSSGGYRLAFASGSATGSSSSSGLNLAVRSRKPVVTQRLDRLDWWTPEIVPTSIDRLILRFELSGEGSGHNWNPIVISDTSTSLDLPITISKTPSPATPPE